MGNIVGGIVPIVIGCTFIVLRQWMANESFKFQDRAYGFHVGGEKVKKIYSIIAVIIGLIAITYGILTLLGIVK